MRAVAAIRDKWPKVRLVVLGSGSERHQLARLVAELGVMDSVVFTGESNSPARLFDWADLLVHPSLYEGYPRVFAEAIAAGTPVVSIDSPYARELTKGGASVFLARPMDSASLAATIVEALQNVGSTNAHNGYGADASICGLCELYAGLPIRADRARASK
ncbi:glycosyltransferase [Kibdelosporangium philippinense]|uniref:glycosyltransferase n=1 Tax=Kibdelosporangium philippinense TaxID=211113 RepID=UPI00360A49DF